MPGQYIEPHQRRGAEGETSADRFPISRNAKSIFLSRDRCEPDRKHGSARVCPGMGPNPHLGSMLTQNFATHPQAETGSVVTLGCEKSFKEMIAYRRRYALSGIGNAHPNSRLTGAGMPLITAAQDELATAPAGIERVGDQIRKYLSNLRTRAT